MLSLTAMTGILSRTMLRQSPHRLYAKTRPGGQAIFESGSHQLHVGGFRIKSQIDARMTRPTLERRHSSPEFFGHQFFRPIFSCTIEMRTVILSPEPAPHAQRATRPGRIHRTGVLLSRLPRTPGP